ncbi:nitronate monooxygenase [Anaerofilum sp. An201]|nr:nitronate monooxygenase family protein [Anaerofilum sp. An201]OUP03409.1 nitronate monooxygenase [Anaerofilum sp. An201]
MSRFDLSRLPVPVIQGGMGVGVSLGNLAGHVAGCGGMGVISTANPGYAEPDFWQDPGAANLRALTAQIRKAKEIAGGMGMVAINAMVATTRYAETVAAAIAAGVDAVISGAGLPLELPGIPGADRVALAPIVSGGKAANTICKLWHRRFSRMPDFVVVEGPLAGGHLGFSREEAEHPRPLEELVGEVCAALEPWRARYGQEIPVFAAGGVFDGADIARMQAAGAAGAQIATRFIATEECDAAPAYKQRMVEAKAEDVRIVKSPVGMPGRALYSPLIRRLETEGRIPPTRCANCLVPCDPAATPYCITRALIEAVKGNWEEGLFFCGANVGRIQGITTVKTLMQQLTTEWQTARRSKP